MFALVVVSLAGVRAYTVQDGYAIENDSRVYMRSPYTITHSGWYNYTIETKNYSGNINAVFGFNTTNIQPNNPQLYHLENTTRKENLSCNIKIKNLQLNYTTNPKIAECWNTDTNAMIWSSYYDTIYPRTYEVEISINETKEYYTDITEYFTKIDANYDGKDTWYIATGVPITPNKPLQWRAYFNIPVGTEAKYDYAAYPSAYGTTKAGIQNAISDGNLYLLDPFIDSSNYEIGNVTNNTNTWDIDKNTTSTVALTNDNKAFEMNKQSNATLTSGILTYYDMDGYRYRHL